MAAWSQKTWAGIVVCGLLAWGCGRSGGKGSASDDGDTEGGGSTTTGSTPNTLASAYPGGLAISVFPDDKGTTSLMLNGDDAKTLTMAAKAKEADAILKGDRDCLGQVFSRQARQPVETCYQFDQEMIYGRFGSSNVFAGTLNGKNASGEACLVAFARSQVKEVEVIIDRALGMVQAMFCQAKKAGLASSLPKEGESIDYSTVLKTAFGDKAARIAKASLTRLPNQDNRPLYRSDITIEGVAGDLQETHLVHSPASEADNGTYEGVLWTKVSGIEKVISNIGPMGADDPKNPYLSIQYVRTKSGDKTQLKAQLLRARVIDALAVNAFKNGVLDLNVSTNSSHEYVSAAGTVYPMNKALSGISYIGLNVDPETGAGAVAYWQNPGSNDTESARGMVFNLTADSTKQTLDGCGLTGARKGSTLNPGDGISIRKAVREGLLASMVPNGFFHPFFNIESSGNPANPTSCGPVSGQAYDYGCTNGSQWYAPRLASSLKTDWVTKQMGTTVSRQCVVQNPSTGVYEIDTAKISEEAGFVVIDGSAPPSSDKVDAPDLSGFKTFELN